MDDSVFCFSDTSAAHLEQKAGQLCGLLLQKCSEFAMTPNLSPGKTAIMLIFQGPGSKAARLRNFGPNSPKTLPVITDRGVHMVHLVTSYTHLGCLLHHKGDMRQEARRRFSIAQTAFQQHRRVLYQNRHLSLKRRAELCQTLILSKFVYGCESWTLDDARTRHYVHTSLLRLYKRLLPGQQSLQIGDDAALMATKLPDPSDLFRMQRLRHLGALYTTPDSAAWGVINADRVWTDLVCSDLHWMWIQLQGASTLPDPRQHFSSWTYLMVYHRNYWKKLIKRAGAHAAAQRDNLHTVQCFHRSILETLQDHHCLITSPPTEIKVFSDELHGCMACERKFQTKGGCGAHMFRVHGITTEVRMLFDTTQCGCCLREFHSHGKLQGHLQRAEYCRRSLQRRGQFFQPAPGIGSTTNNHQERLHDRLLPPLQAQGPSNADRHQIDYVEYDLSLFEAIYQALLDASSEEDGLRIIRECVKGRPITWERFQKTLQCLTSEATTADIEVLPFDGDTYRKLLATIATPTSWPFMCESLEVKNGHWNRDLHSLSEYCTIEAQDPRRCTLRPPTPRGFGKERYFLHLFSGRRRPGDLQFFLDRLCSSLEGVTVHVISLDVVINNTWGDLLQPSTRQFWLTAIRQRLVIGLLGGPPCETWSQAREQALATRPFAPRVLRTAEFPWGLESLRLRELIQISVGNTLMGFQLEAVVELFCVGGIAITEHPAPPVAEMSVSIWKTPIIALLKGLPGFEVIQLSQGLWGAKSRKPTSLLVLNMPGILSDLRMWQITKDVPTATSIGVDSSGQWSTTALKEYPPALNAAFAQGLFTAMHECHSDTSVQVPQAFRECCHNMICTAYGDSIGPDFAGS